MQGRQRHLGRNVKISRTSPAWGEAHLDQPHAVPGGRRPGAAGVGCGEIPPVAAVAWEGFGHPAPQDKGPQAPGITQDHQSVETRRAPRGRGQSLVLRGRGETPDTQARLFRATLARGGGGGDRRGDPRRPQGTGAAGTPRERRGPGSGAGRGGAQPPGRCGHAPPTPRPPPRAARGGPGGKTAAPGGTRPEPSGPERTRAEPAAMADELSDLLREFDEVMEDFDRGPACQYQQHLEELKSKAGHSVYDSGIDELESTSTSPGSSLNSSEEDLNTPANAYPSKAKLGDTQELEEFIADLDKVLEEM
ncbi:uncharacterized protein J5F26_010628 isoform 3-T3 [Ciconia maguari]